MRGHLGPPFIPQRTSSAVCAHHGAQLPVLQTRARERVNMVRAATLGGVIWLGNGITEMQ
eukprot:10422612-Lingulodinium_polyedra.AAC.1